MSKPAPQPILTIEIDAALAAAYRNAYLRAFGTRDDVKKTLEQFVAGFVEDQLAEEIAFVEEEVTGGD